MLRANGERPGEVARSRPLPTIIRCGTAVAAVMLALPSGPGAFVYWSNSRTGTIGRANLDGSGVNQSFVTGADLPLGVAVDASHLYWSNSNRGTIGRANLGRQRRQPEFHRRPERPAVQRAAWAFSARSCPAGAARPG